MLDALGRRFFLPINVKAEVLRPGTQIRGCPSVSVIIPCYNYGRYLDQCVGSVLDQSGVKVDILIIDDASSDGSDQLVREFGAKDSRIRTICHTANQGHITTYNEGIAHVTGDYTVVLSADDLLTPGCLARATALMEEHPSVGLTYGFPVDFMDGSLPATRTTPRSWIIWQGSDWIAQRCKTGRNILRSPEAVIRTSVLREVGGYQVHLPHAADFELWMRVATVSDVGYVAGADQAYYRLHSRNMHQSVFAMIDDFSQRLASFDTVFNERSSLLRDPASMREMAHRALARSALSQAVRDTAHRALARSRFSGSISAHLSGAVGDEPIEAYREFALKAWPHASELTEWRTLHRLFNRSRGEPGLSPSLLARMAMRKLRTRARLWRKRSVGI
jgi:glycosyltransferase involved in cell wall biosynthesis